jgi:hypothetical protein
MIPTATTIDNLKQQKLVHHNDNQSRNDVSATKSQNFVYNDYSVTNRLCPKQYN